MICFFIPSFSSSQFYHGPWLNMSSSQVVVSHASTGSSKVSDWCRPVQIFPSEHVPLSTGSRTGGLSSFGFGGTNAQALLGESEVPVLSSLQRPPGYVKKAFPWRDIGFRLLRLSLSEKSFEVTMSNDVYDIVSHHVVFGSIVTPGVVYVEMALEATRKLFGHDVALKDVTMVFPFVVPDRFGDAPPPIMRFVLKSDTRFEIQSSANGKTTTHVEASLERDLNVKSRGSLGSLDLEELQSRITEPIETSVVYEAIHSVGLYLGPMFQVAKKLWRRDVTAEKVDGLPEVLGLLQLDFPGVKNSGYIVHPALLDGTIHILATASIGKDVSGLKIFGGVGKVVVVKKDNFSKLDRYWVHMQITESLEASQTFNVTVAADDGSILMYMEDVVFRAVKPEQIQMAISAQGARDDDQKLYEVEWIEANVERNSCEGKGLVLADSNEALSALKAQFSDSSISFLKPEEGSIQSSLWDLKAFEWILYFASSHERSSLVENLLIAVELLQSLAVRHPKFQCLIFGTRNTQAVKVGDMSGMACPLHAGLWGLARAFRNEDPTLRVFCMDLTTKMELKLLRQMPEASHSSEFEVALRFQTEQKETVALVPRLQEAKMEEVGTWEASPKHSYVITGGLGGLGLTFASWLVEQKAKSVALISRSGKPQSDCQVAFRRLTSRASKVSVHKVDITDMAEVKQVMKAIAKQAPIKGIIHAAGLLDDHMVIDLQPLHVTSVLAPKADGTLNLHEACRTDLDFFALFSSVASLLGTPAQGNYCAANAFMDSFCSFLRDNGRNAVSIQWGPWAEVGMAARANTSEASIARISASKGLEAMSAILASSQSLRNGVIGVARIKWATLLGQLGTVPPLLSKFSVAKSSSSPVGNYTLEDVKSLVVGSLADALGTEDFDISTPLMELGLDSLAGVEFRNRLQARTAFRSL